MTTSLPTHTEMLCILSFLLHSGANFVSQLSGEDACEVSNSEDAYKARRHSYISLCTGHPSPLHSDFQQLSVW